MGAQVSSLYKEEEKDYFRVRWDHYPLAMFEECGSFRAGDVVELVDYDREFVLGNPEKCPVGDGALWKRESNRGFVKVRIVYPKDRADHVGYVHASYLDSIAKDQLPNSRQAQELIADHHVSREVREARWFVQNAHLFEIALFMAQSDEVGFGEFLVVRPLEWAPRSAHADFSPYCLLVKVTTGNSNYYFEDWNRQFWHSSNPDPHGRQGREKLQLDRFPGVRAPPPPILFFLIHRTSTGRFMIYRDCENPRSFLSMQDFIQHHMNRRLVADFNGTLLLTRPAAYFKNPQPGPKLRETNRKANTVEPNESEEHRVFSVPPEVYTRFRVLLGNRIPANVSISGRLHKAVLHAETIGVQKAAIRLLNRGHFNAEKLTELAQKLSGQKFPQGRHYLAEFLGFRIDDVELKHSWIAYELISGISLTLLLQQHAAESRQFTPRTMGECLYQISAAMYFLENNGLCHMSLCGSNCIVTGYNNNYVALKVTDYAMPHHILFEHAMKHEVAKLKWKWLSPEAVMNAQYNIRSDIYSFGCTMFELFHYGRAPYYFEKEKIETVNDLRNFWTAKKKMRIGPKGGNSKMPAIFVKVFDACLKLYPQQRPPFRRLLFFFKEFLCDAVNGTNRAISNFYESKDATVANERTEEIAKAKKR